MPPHSKPKDTAQVMKSAAYEGKGTFACSRLHHLGSVHSLEADNIEHMNNRLVMLFISTNISTSTPIGVFSGHTYGLFPLAVGNHVLIQKRLNYFAVPLI